MKNSIRAGFFLLLTVVLAASTFTDNKNALDARLNTFRQECKDLIRPARYEGSRVTYYTLTKKSQQKSVEVFMLVDAEYTFAISGKECSSGLTIRFYDSANKNDRKLIQEIKSAQGLNTLVSSTELNAVYHQKMPQSGRLKSTVVEYEIAGGMDKTEAVVLVIGYK
jgi:hypothetical protein